MPVQKGKRRNRPGRRVRPSRGALLEESPASPVPTTSKQARPPRRRWDLPLWANVTAGVFLLGIGILFALIPQKGFTSGERIIILAAYVALSAVYLSKAFRQYRSRQP